MYILKLDDEFLSGFGSFSLPGYEVSGCRLETAVNEVGHLTFTIYPEHPLYEQVTEPKRIITLLRYDENEPLFIGRVCESERGFYNEKTVVCESELAFLLDSVRTDFSSTVGYGISTWLEKLLDYHNSHGDIYGGIYPDNIARKFYRGNVSSDLSVLTTCPRTENFSGTLTTLEIISRLLLEPFGGVLKMRHEDGKNYVDWLSGDDLTVSSRKIKLGSNLIDLQRQKKLDQLVTAVRPTGDNVDTGGRSEPLSIRLTDVSGYISGSDIKQAVDETVSAESVLRYSDCLYSESLVAKYGWIQREVNFPNVTAVSSLTKKAVKYLQSVSEWESMTITAADISSEGSGIDSFRAGDMVEVSSEVHGVMGKYMVTAAVIDLDDPSANTLEIGSETDAISSMSGSGGVSYAGGVVGGSGLFDPVGAADAALKSAQTYADKTDAETLAAAKVYSETGDSDTLSKAREYTDSIMEQKADLSHTHTKSDITDFPEALPASDVYPWAKESEKPSYTWDEITSKPENLFDTVGSGLTAEGTTIKHTDTVTATGFGDQLQSEYPGWGGTIALPWGRNNSTGHITAVGTTTVHLPEKPEYTWDEIADKPETYPPEVHSHYYAASA
ncbi:MAG: phage tail protein, partial [Porcipelethomonas sp.]